MWRYRYTDDAGKPLSRCPTCGYDLVNEGVYLKLRKAEGEWTELSRLDCAGYLADRYDSVAQGNHSATHCIGCSNMLINLPGVNEIECGSAGADNISTCCRFCGGEMQIDDNGVSNHLTEDGDIDYEADADHVAVSDDEVPLNQTPRNGRSEKSLLDLVIDLLESGDDAFCDGLVVVGLAEFLALRKEVSRTGAEYGAVSADLDEDEEQHG